MEHTSTWKVQFSCVHIIVAFLKKIINFCVFITEQVKLRHTRSRYILRSLFTLCVRWNKRLSIVVRASSFWYRLPLQEPMHTKDCHAYTTHNLLMQQCYCLCVCVDMITPVTIVDSCNVEMVCFWLKRCNLNNIPSRDWLTVQLPTILFLFYTMFVCVLNMWGVCIHDFTNTKREKQEVRQVFI